MQFSKLLRAAPCGLHPQGFRPPCDFCHHPLVALAVHPATAATAPRAFGRVEAPRTVASQATLRLLRQLGSGQLGIGRAADEAVQRAAGGEPLDVDAVGDEAAAGLPLVVFVLAKRREAHLARHVDLMRMWKKSLPALVIMYLFVAMRAASKHSLVSCWFSSTTKCAQAGKSSQGCFFLPQSKMRILGSGTPRQKRDLGYGLPWA
eukprot:CAMPEP_0204121562 /NCGR_PEP_ID=MMETSP0361-20130328/8270_1 /ASSEMBLY_ACC=CAM_ASM_000343 /TAXON_ID=268821 /ORGANISM="Scrippsiella Hangoei, Strain SHTV-5" /LENGTH=204 /DNA_ID=CAMNT_0051072871 /DNA_START=158 /DNA_END=773 /DNA_ORIENTATION=+